ncbi:MAG: type III PLP-dependent enzyme, partial [Rhodospirillales bacterium]|nr:type III PLP-dependent enzyme [Rhodospirillales bacterium]
MNADNAGPTSRFVSTAALIDALHPDRPVHCFRPAALHDAATAFVDGFPGDTLYAVKCNAHPLVLRGLYDAGIRCFDVASDHEIALIRKHCPEAEQFYHHPAKTPPSIRAAYDDAGVRRFVVDCHEELAKTLAHTGADAAITVRMAVPQDKSVYDLSTKFGAKPDLARALLAAASAAGRTVGVTFHVGSQCLDPFAYERAIRIAADTAAAAGVTLAYMDIGGGFPGYYATTDAPPWGEYFTRIGKVADEVCRPHGTRLLCEPGRALVYGSASLLTRVILRKERIVYLNDGIFGGFAEIYWGGQALVLTCRVHRPGGTPAAETAPFTIYGPTCDSTDKFPEKVWLPAG